MKKFNGEYTALLCDDCGVEIFADLNMVMLKDELWKSICDKHEDAYCDKCMEKRLGREIAETDFKPGSKDGPIPGIVLCNYVWLHLKNQSNIQGSSQHS